MGLQGLIAVTADEAKFEWLLGTIVHHDHIAPLSLSEPSIAPLV